MKGRRATHLRTAAGFTLIELLVVIAIIAILMAVLMPALSAAKKQATSAACLSNQKSLMIGWIMYSDENDDLLMCNGACYEQWQGSYDPTPWVHSPMDLAGNRLATPPPAITDEDRFRGIQAGTMWPYVRDVDVYHCPGDNRRNTRQPPRDCFRSYSLSYAFGPLRAATPEARGGYRYYERMIEVRNAALYYVLIEEEHNGSQYGENEGGWHLPFTGAMNRLNNPASWTFYDPLASYHIKASTFGFADGHSEKIKWRDKRTLEFIQHNADDPSTHSGFNRTSPGNEDLQWLLEHFIAQDRIE